MSSCSRHQVDFRLSRQRRWDWPIYQQTQLLLYSKDEVAELLLRANARTWWPAKRIQQRRSAKLLARKEFYPAKQETPIKTERQTQVPLLTTTAHVPWLLDLIGLWTWNGWQTCYRLFAFGFHLTTLLLIILILKICKLNLYRKVIWKEGNWAAVGHPRGIIMAQGFVSIFYCFTVLILFC